MINIDRQIDRQMDRLLERYIDRQIVYLKWQATSLDIEDEIDLAIYRKIDR